MKKLLLMVALLLATIVASAQPDTKSVTFVFKPGDAMFYGTEVSGNMDKLQELYDLVDQYKSEIARGEIPIYVDAYSTSGGNEPANKNLSFVRANRVKSELIAKRAFSDSNFITRNLTDSYQDQGDVVVVTLRVPQIEQPKVEKPEPTPKPEPQPVVERPKQEPAPQPEAISEVAATPAPGRWSVGAYVGVPLFWGDFVSLSEQKNYIGAMGGVQASYQAMRWLGFTLSADFGKGKAGSRGYAQDYMLDNQGMTWYTPQAGTVKPYRDLYSTIGFVNLGLAVDLNVITLLAPQSNSRWSVLASPTIYAQHFSPKVFTKADDKEFTTKHLSGGWSMGLGGSLGVRYGLTDHLGLQLKTGAIWITDNDFDGIATAGQTKQNAMGFSTLGVIWKF